VFEVVVATPDVVGERMAGPGIRVTHFARQLAKLPGVRVTVVDRDGDRAAFRRADVLIGQPARGFFKRRPGQRVVYDLFDPLVLELRELYGERPSMRQRLHVAAEWTRLQFALANADLLMTAAPQQREFYEQLEWRDVPWINVPFGIDLAEVKACATPADNVVVWGGGVWEWLDPKTAVEAIVRLNRGGLRCRLLFLGRSRPNQAVVERRREDRFSRLIASGAPWVDANEEWVPYRDRLAWLRAAKIAIMLHRSTAESRYAVRTRIFDAIAAGVPVVATERGFAAELVAREGLGIVVPPGDVDAVAAAIRRLLTNDEFHRSCVTNLERIRPAFAWEVVTRPLADAVIRWQKRSER
jgi:glycosyltransferase involved in cell wall biosynthesis